MKIENQKKYRILVIEDNPEILELLDALLTAQGFEVFTCVDGAKALEKFNKKDYSLVILDMMLPGKSGFDICKELRAEEKGAHIPLIILSALAQKTEIEKGIDCGADIYITKPYENKHLIEQINKLLRTE
ncbi:MAG: response regulator [bacterium]